MKVFFSSIASAIVSAIVTVVIFNPMTKTDLSQHAIIATFIEAYCKQKPGDIFNLGATAAMSVVAQRAGLGSITTLEASKCIVASAPSSEFLAQLAADKYEAELRKKLK